MDDFHFLSVVSFGNWLWIVHEWESEKQWSEADFKSLFSQTSTEKL